MYKNVIFDLGGVVVKFNPESFLLDRFCSAEIEEKVCNITFRSEEWSMLDAGNLSRLQGNEIMMQKAREAGCAYEVQAVLDDWMRHLNTKQRTVEIMHRLHKMGFHLYFLSNIASDTFALIRQRDFFSLFEGGIASCDVHINKPDPKIYQIMLERYQLAPEETLFIDDNKVNADAASELGITGIHYQDSSALIQSLNANGIPLKDHFLW